MVTHVTDVKPLASVLTYLDEESNTEIYQEVRHEAGGLAYTCTCVQYYACCTAAPDRHLLTSTRPTL